MGQLTEQLGTSVYLDTNIIIYAVEGYETHAAPIKSLLQGLTEGVVIARQHYCRQTGGRV